MYKTWLQPAQCDPPHEVKRPEQVEALAVQFMTHGWGAEYPALVGYKLKGRIQLLSGSHRWAAADITNTPIPVVVFSQAFIERWWGDLDMWRVIMESGNP